MIRSAHVCVSLCVSHNTAHSNSEILHLIFQKITIVQILSSRREDKQHFKLNNNHYYYYPFNGLFSGTTWVSRYQKGTSQDINKARDDGVLGCSGISWTICKQSAPRSRQITTQTPHHSVFLQAGCSSWRPTNSVKAQKAQCAFKLNKWKLLLNYVHHQYSALLARLTSCSLASTDRVSK